MQIIPIGGEEFIFFKSDTLVKNLPIIFITVKVHA